MTAEMASQEKTTGPSSEARAKPELGGARSAWFAWVWCLFPRLEAVMRVGRAMAAAACARRVRWLVGLCSIGALGAWAAPARAITYTQQTLPIAGLSSPNSAALDSAGDVYVANDGDSDVVELLAGGSQRTLPFTGLNLPRGVAVDSTGDVFVVDADNNDVVELPANGAGGYGPQITLPFTGLDEPEGVGVDSGGDVFVVNELSDDVVELPANGSGGYRKQITLPFSEPANPATIAIDSRGNLYVDTDGDAFSKPDVVELPANGSGGYGPQITLPFIGLGDPEGVAVDSTGDVYVVDFVGGSNGDGEVLELPASGSGGFGSQQTLPVSGLLDPEGVAVDSAGDVYIGGFFGNDVLELSADTLSGSLIFSPGSGPDNTGISVSSVTPCPLISSSSIGFGSTSAALAMYSLTGAVVTTGSATLDSSGDWTGTLTVPPTAANGTYTIGARCNDAEGVDTQNYAYGAFTVGAESVVTGPQGPPGPEGNAGNNGTNGAAGAAGSQGPKGDQGAAGAAGPAGPSPTSSKTRCETSVKSRTGSTTTCTITYTFSGRIAAKALVDGDRAEATAMADGKTSVVATGRINGHKVVLLFKHLQRRRYRLTLLEFRNAKRLVVGHTTLDIS